MAVERIQMPAEAPYLWLPGQESPYAIEAAKAQGNNLNPQRGSGRFTQILIGDQSSARTTDGLTTSGNARMRDYTSYLHAYSIPTVWKALNEIASTMAATELRVLDEDDRQVDIKHDLPAFWDLWNQPNSETAGYDFRLLMIMDDQLTGNVITALDEQNGRGEPAALYRLRPDKVGIVRAPNDDLIYLYSPNPTAIIDPIPYFPGEIIHGKWPHPTNPLWGLGVIEAGEVSFSADRRIQEFRYAYFDRGGVLEGVLTHDGDLSDDEYNRLLTRWRALRGGGRATMKTAILTEGARYEPIQEPLGNVPIVALSRMSRNDILELFGVPPQVLGDFAETNYHNAQEAKAYFYADTVSPILTRMELLWTLVVRRFDPTYRAEYVRREILDYQLRAQTALYLAQTASFTRNDIRVAAGYDPFPEDDPVGKVIVSTTRAVELFPTDYEEPNDLLPLTQDPVDLQDQRAPQGLDPGMVAQEAALDATEQSSQGGAKRYQRADLARGQPPYPVGLTSAGYKSSQQARQRAIWKQRANVKVEEVKKKEG